MGNCGWAVKTKNHLLIFDYWQFGSDPDELLLANGRINPEEIKNENVVVFVTYSDYDHYDEVIFEWEKYNKNITYIFGWDVEKKGEYNRVKPGDGSSDQWLDVEFLRKSEDDFDLVFLTVFGGALETSEKLEAKVMFPMHGNAAQYKAYADEAVKRNLTTKVHNAENRGDRFFYSNGKIVK